MSPNTLVIYGGLLLMAMLLLLIGMRINRRQESGEIVERLERFANGYDNLGVDLAENQKRGPGRIAQFMETVVRGRPFAAEMASLLARADVRLTVGELVTLRTTTAIGAFTLSWNLCSGAPRIVSLILSVVIGTVGFFGPVAYLSFRAKRRVKQFIDQLGDVITMMANSLRAGYSLLQTLEMVSREAPDPIATEFRRVVREVGLGISTEEAMNHLLQRVPSEDLDLLVTAINIQHEVGGNLAQILTIIGHTIRERVRIKGEIRVLTAQQEISGYVISALPIGLGLIIFLVNPDYIGELFVWPYLIMPIGAAIMIVIGFSAMKKITAIEV